jgi:hypothetical protein
LYNNAPRYLRDINSQVELRLSFWYVMSWLIVPNIKFYCKIPVEFVSDQEIRRFKFENVGWSSIIDVQVLVRLRLALEGGKRTRSVYLRLDTNQIPYIPARTWLHRKQSGIDEDADIKSFSVGEAKKYDKNRTRIISIHPEFNTVFDSPFFERRFRDQFANRELTLMDVMKLDLGGEGALNTLEIIVYGTNWISRTRRVFISELYTIHDLLLTEASIKDEIQKTLNFGCRRTARQKR